MLHAGVKRPVAAAISTCKGMKGWSGRPGSNRRPTAWKAETLPLSYSRVLLFSTCFNVPYWALVVQMCPNGGSLHKACTNSRPHCPNAQNRRFGARFMHSPDWLSVLHLCTPTSLNLPRLATSQGPPVACRRSGWSRPWSGEVGLGSACPQHRRDSEQSHVHAGTNGMRRRVFRPSLLRVSERPLPNSSE